MSEWTESLAGLAAIVTLGVAVFEYLRQGRLKRVEQFLALRRVLDADPIFCRVRDALDDAPESLRAMPTADRRRFLELVEEIALLVRTGLLPLTVAHYWYGWYVMAAWDSDDLWSGFDANERDHDHWALLRHFTADLRYESSRLASDVRDGRAFRRRLRFWGH